MTKRFAVAMTDPARHDITSIYDYLQVHASPDIAADLLHRMLERIDNLAQFPRRGARVAEFDGTEEVRQFLIGVYRGIYIVENDMVLIVAVFDGRRNIRALLERRLFYRPD